MVACMATPTPSEEVFENILSSVPVFNDMVSHQTSEVGVTADEALPAVSLEDLESERAPFLLGEVPLVAALPAVVVGTAELGDVFGGFGLPEVALSDGFSVGVGDDLLGAGGSNLRLRLFGLGGSELCLPLVAQRDAFVMRDLPLLGFAELGLGLGRQRDALVVGDLALLEGAAIGGMSTNGHGIASSSPAEPVHVAPAVAVDGSVAPLDGAGHGGIVDDQIGRASCRERVSLNV